MVANRSGSAVYKIIVKGKSAHVGRDFHNGVNAITHLANILSELTNQKNWPENSLINLGKVSGGEKANVVAEYAECLINIRSKDTQKMNETVDLIKTILKNSKAKEVELIEIYNREPKVICNKTKDFIKLVTEVSTENNIPINWKDTGGVCDGNILQNEGLPTIDTFGANGDYIHTHNEYLIPESIKTKIKLVSRVIDALNNT